MKVLIVTWDGGGNAPPFYVLAAELAARSHDVNVLSEASAADRWSGMDVTFRAWSPDVEVVRGGRMPESERIPLILRRLWFGAAAARELHAHLETDAYDACVIDHCLSSSAAAAESLRVPTAALFHTVRRAARMGPPRFQEWLPVLNEVRDELGLAPLASVAQAWSFAGRRIICTAGAFDAPHLETEPGDLYVGPIGRPEASGRAPAIDGHGPLVLVSFSTTWQDQLDALQETIDGLASIGVRALVTVGPEIDPAELRAPEPIVVTSFAAHADVLPQTDVVVTHAGHGTVMAALAAGVPLVCLPMGRDQFMNAALVESSGAGLKVEAPAAIPGAVQRVLTEPTFRAHAQRLAGDIAAEPGVAAAADAVEHLCRA